MIDERKIPWRHTAKAIWLFLTGKASRRAGGGAVAALVMLVGVYTGAQAGQPAFPGALGFGATATGWRGGAIIEVSNLDDKGPGSLRACAEDRTRAKICVFTVSGTIVLDTAIFIASNTYIAGQTAPGGGIQLKIGKSLQSPLFIRDAHDVLVRFVKLRPGESARPSPNIDGITILNGENVYLDHLSIAFGTDENVNIHVNRRPARNITIANSIVALGLDHTNHPKNKHSKGALICSDEGSTYECGRISLVGNLFAHNRDRNPDIKGTDTGPVEVINNVFYNAISQFGEFYDLIGNTRINYIGNVALQGPSTRRTNRPAAIEAFDWEDKYTIEIFEKDNLNLVRPHCAGSQEIQVVDENALPHIVDHPLEPLATMPIAASATLDHVLKTAGSKRPGDTEPDALDRQIVSDVLACKGKVIDDPEEVGGWPQIRQENAKADLDRDGMPDDWESANGLDPHDSGDAWTVADGKGWPNIEIYLSTLAGDFAAASTPGPAPTGYAESTGAPR